MEDYSYVIYFGFFFLCSHIYWLGRNRSSRLGALFSCQDQYEHSFKPAMKLEAVNPLSPENIHVATVAKVKGQYIWLSLEGEMLLSKNVFNSLMSRL